MRILHEEPRGDAPTTRPVAEHHRALDDRIERLLARAREDDPPELNSEWTAFERELLRHLAFEESEILPAFARYDLHEARALLRAHAALRNAMMEIGLTLDLHCLRVEGIEAFVRSLKAHAAREEAVFRAWAWHHLASDNRHAIKRGLKGTARVGAGLELLAHSFM